MKTKSPTYICPMHPEVKQHKPGHCPKCGMDLVLEGDVSGDSHHMEEPKDNYLPLIKILGLIALSVGVVSIRSWMLGTFSLGELMMNSMAGFFLVFSGFKILDLKGFAQGYSTYDLLAKKFFTYGYIYPFLELILGLLYLTHTDLVWLNICTFILMAFSGLGVAIKLLKKEKFQCACLGTFIKVPLTKVTLIEDFGMAFMALVMIFMS